jgi:hypothetical protein
MMTTTTTTTATTTNKDLLISNKAICNLLKIKEIDKAIENESKGAILLFAKSLQKCSYFLTASNNWTDAKNLDTKLFESYKDKYEFFDAIFNYKKTQSAMFVKIGKFVAENVENNALENFHSAMLLANKIPTLHDLDKFISENKDVKNNTTTEDRKSTRLNSSHNDVV